MTTYLSFVLAIEYGIAVFVRLRALRAHPEFRGWYHLSILCCMISALSFAWLLTYGDSPARLIVVRMVQLVLVPSALIWPAVIATHGGRDVSLMRTRHDRKIRERQDA